MEQIKAHIAVSLDGHTATPDYELDWMPREVKELAAREHAAASCLLASTACPTQLPGKTGN